MDLHEAAGRGDVTQVQKLLEAGADVDEPDPWENTPLLLACFSEDHFPEVVGLLRSHGADPHRQNIHGETPRTKAYERYLLIGFDPLADLPPPEETGKTPHALTEAELRAVVKAVRALVERDREELDRMHAYEGGDPYEWTCSYGRWGQVDLVMPPGEPDGWSIDSYRSDDDDEFLLTVEMWTRQEGRSDLTLELELHPADGGAHRAEFVNLHVM